MLVINSMPSGGVIRATYDGKHADVRTKTVQRHIPSDALQRWNVSGGVLTISTDQLFGAGFQ